jgi:hypothetical protein
MDPFWFRGRNWLTSDTRSAGRWRPGSTRPPVKPGLLLDLPRSVERSAMTKESPGRREMKTSPWQVEAAGQRPRAQSSLLEEKMTRGWVSRTGTRELELEARVPVRRPTKRQSPLNRPHSSRRWAPPRAALEVPEQSSSLAHLNLAHSEKRTSRADNPRRKFGQEMQEARADRPHAARQLARSRPETPRRRAAPRKTHSRAAQSLSDREVLPRRANQ